LFLDYRGSLDIESQVDHFRKLTLGGKAERGKEWNKGGFKNLECFIWHQVEERGIKRKEGLDSKKKTQEGE